MVELWGVLELHNDALEEHSSELLATLVELARRQTEAAEVCAVLLIAPDAPLPDLAPLGVLGIEQVYILAHPRLARYAAASWVGALAWMLQEQERTPLLVVSGATANGRDWMPRLAARLRLPFAPGCLSIDVQDDALYALHPIYEGRAYAQTRASLKGHTALATLLMGTRGNPVAMEDSSESKQSLHISTFTPSIETMGMAEQVQQIVIQAPSPEEVELEEAERIVAGGRGIGQEGFTHVAVFARMLGAAVGATRVATDRGWVEHARQIGATGKSVHPRLYIACGISGAAQHTSGMREAQTIIAINPDRTAPIFALADLGLLGDANQVLPLAAKLITKD
jgi:electron transfer flavoprotein alpha subunit